MGLRQFNVNRCSQCNAIGVLHACMHMRWLHIIMPMDRYRTLSESGVSLPDEGALALLTRVYASSELDMPARETWQTGRQGTVGQ